MPDSRGEFPAFGTPPKSKRKIIEENKTENENINLLDQAEFILPTDVEAEI